MVEAAEKIGTCIVLHSLAFGKAALLDKIANCAKHVESTFGRITSAKQDISSYPHIRFLKALHTGPVPDPSAAFASITGQVWDELGNEREGRKGSIQEVGLKCP